MPRRRRTPQEKKILSYQNDRRNAYGESDKASRKAIPKRKRLAARSQRRTAKTALTATSDVSAAPTGPARRKGWTKHPDRPLADHLEDAYDYGRDGLDRRREDKRGLRAEARRRLKRSR